jgi:hypothetical protein
LEGLGKLFVCQRFGRLETMCRGAICSTNNRKNTSSGENRLFFSRAWRSVLEDVLQFYLWCKGFEFDIEIHTFWALIQR